MSHTVRLLAAATLLASAALTGTTGCSPQVVPEPDRVITLRHLPADDHPERTRKRTLDFRTYLANTRPDYGGVADHVVAVQGDWDADGGRVLIATDYPGGPSRPEKSVAPRITEAFATWARTDHRTGLAAVYDRSGELLYAGGRF
ncbi:hypothetical protein [Streptomyces meridianus]|uniref:Lipoprotein n=1 Tax=Streptomyces meridianus TaxID=2938945 RepID=A0ABT0X5Y3_9ACTN|nr:hypothetical protein [Streptomyces meridianus]MCM2577936.1 hypothetical protein [Streptomyces meridianus]